jgi:repressor LexA
MRFNPNLTIAQQELYDWLVIYIQEHQHAPCIREMVVGMRLNSVAPIQSRLEHLRRKGYIQWADGQARTIQVLKSSRTKGIPVLGAITFGTAS